jgi:hypothetical protein
MKISIPPFVAVGLAVVALALLVGAFLWKDARQAREVDDLVRQGVAGGGKSANRAPGGLPAPR